MKIPIHDIQHVINQIKRASPPITKEMHKLINNLAILLEKNTEKKDSSQEAVLTATYEQLNEFFLDLCFLRRDIVIKYAEEYRTDVAAVEKVLAENRKVVDNDKCVPQSLIDWNLQAECADTCELISYIFGKLNKAKIVVEESLKTKSADVKTLANADAYFEAYVSKL